MTTPDEFQSELNKLDDPMYTKGPLVARLMQMSGGEKIGDFACKLFGGRPSDVSRRVLEHAASTPLSASTHPRLDGFSSMDELRAELSEIAGDQTYEFRGRYKNPDQVYSFAVNGPNCGSIDEMSEGQKNMAEMILNNYATRRELDKREPRS